MAGGITHDQYGGSRSPSYSGGSSTVSRTGLSPTNAGFVGPRSNPYGHASVTGGGYPGVASPRPMTQGPPNRPDPYTAPPRYANPGAANYSTGSDMYGNIGQRGAWVDGDRASNIRPVPTDYNRPYPPQPRPAGYFQNGPNNPFEGLGPNDVWDPQTRQFVGPQQAQSMPRARPGTVGRNMGGPDLAVPRGWSDERVAREMADAGVPNRRIRQAIADAGVNKPRPKGQAGPQRSRGRNAPRNAPRPKARPEYDGRYGRPGANNPPYPSMNESNARQMEAARFDRGGAHRAFEARYDSGRYTPEQAARAVDRQYGRPPAIGRGFNNPGASPWGSGPGSGGDNRGGPGARVGGYDGRGGMSGTYGTRGSTLGGVGQAGGFGGYSPSRYR